MNSKTQETIPSLRDAAPAPGIIGRLLQEAAREKELSSRQSRSRLGRSVLLELAEYGEEYGTDRALSILEGLITDDEILFAVEHEASEPEGAPLMKRAAAYMESHNAARERTEAREAEDRRLAGSPLVEAFRARQVELEEARRDAEIAAWTSLLRGWCRRGITVGEVLKAIEYASWVPDLLGVSLARVFDLEGDDAIATTLAHVEQAVRGPNPRVTAETPFTADIIDTLG